MPEQHRTVGWIISHTLWQKTLSQFKQKQQKPVTNHHRVYSTWSSLRPSPQFRPHTPLTDSRGQPLEQAITAANFFFLKVTTEQAPMIFQTSGAFSLSWSCTSKIRMKAALELELKRVYINTHKALSMQAAGITATNGRRAKTDLQFHINIKFTQTFSSFSRCNRSSILCHISAMLSEFLCDGSIPTWQRWQAGQLTLPEAELHPPLSSLPCLIEAAKSRPFALCTYT